MSYKVVLESSAVKSFQHLKEPTRTKIKKALFRLEFPFDKRNDIKKLKGMKAIYRLRAGKHRILFEVAGNEVIVIDILPRKKAYK